MFASAETTIADALKKKRVTREASELTFLERHDRRPRETRSLDPQPRAFEHWRIQGNVVPFAASNGRMPPFRASAGPANSASVPPPLPAAKPESRKLLIATILISGAIHAAAIASVMSGDGGEQFGTLSSKTDSFSLATTQSLVLESISTSDMDAASAASAAASQAGSVEAAESAPQEKAEVKETPLTDQPPPEPIKVADVTPSAIAPAEDPVQVIRGGGEPDAVSEIKAEEYSETPVEEMPEAVETKVDALAKAKQEEKVEKVEKERKVQQAQSHQQTAGAAASRSSAANAAVDGRVSASRGNALSYAASVRSRVERKKPSGGGLRGTVRVSFAVTPTGELSYVKLSETSGFAKLDEAAMDAIRQAAPFDQPPSGLKPAQLSYVIPFYFR